MQRRQSQEWSKRWVLGEFSWARMVSLLGLIVGISYGYLLFYGLWFAEDQIFFPQPASYSDTDEILKLTTLDGVVISALYLSHPEATHTLLFSHGNAEDLGTVRPLLDDLNALGFAVLAYDYRGYGTSQGHPSEQGTYQDINAAYLYLTEDLGLSPQRIIAYGRSVGSGPTVNLGIHQPLGGMVLESAFVSAFRVVTQIQLLPFDKYNNIQKIAQVNCPVLVIHGSADSTIPIWHGEALYRQIQTAKSSLWVEGAGHNDLQWHGGQQYRQALVEFSQSLGS